MLNALILRIPVKKTVYFENNWRLSHPEVFNSGPKPQYMSTKLYFSPFLVHSEVNLSRAVPNQILSGLIFKRFL